MSEILSDNLTITVKNHFLKRIAQRVYKLNLDEKQAHAYIHINHTTLTLEAHDIWVKCEYLWQGLGVGQYTQMNYYLYERGKEKYTVLTDVHKKELVTIYPIAFDLPGNTSNILTNALIRQIREARRKRAALIQRKSPTLDRRRAKIEQLKTKRAEIDKQIIALEQSISEENKQFKDNLTHIQEVGRILCQSKHFHRDVLTYKEEL